MNSELAYVEDLIFKIAIKHAKGEYEEDGEFKWEYVKGDVASLNDCWNNIVLDLTSVDVPNNDILEYSNKLNDLIIAVSEENQSKMLDDLNGMYLKIIAFEETYSDDKNAIKKDKVKSGILSTYDLVNQENFSEAKIQVISLVEKYKEYMDNDEYVKENAYNLNQVYVLLEEYSASIDSKNIDLIRMKYIVAVEAL